mgnify:CR=1 FL=1
MSDITIKHTPSLNIGDSEGVATLRAAGAKSFGETLKESLQQINTLQVRADQAVQEMAGGRSDNIHETMILLEKADISFRLMMQVRNKLVEAYQEVMRMQV